MADMSVALFTPDFVDAETLASDLETLLADPKHGLMPGMVQFTVIERLNGLMVVTPSAEHLAQVRNWVRRLDRNTGDANPRLFIYRVQNGKATELAEQLNTLFNPSGAESPGEAELAPDLDPAILELEIPMLGICYGLQLLAQRLGGLVEAAGDHEYGRALLKLEGAHPLFAKLGDSSTCHTIAGTPPKLVMRSRSMICRASSTSHLYMMDVLRPPRRLSMLSKPCCAR